MICSAIADFLMYLNAASDYKMRIMLAGRSKQRITDRFSDFTEGEDFCFLEYDSTKPFVLEEDVDYVIHGASSANPSLYSTKPVEIMTSNFVGLANLLNDAVHKTTRVLYISSSEVYGEKNRWRNTAKTSMVL